MNRKVRIILTCGVAALVAILIAWRVLSGSADSSESETAAESLTVQLVSPRLEDWQQSVDASGPITPWQEMVVSSETGGLQVAELFVDVGATVSREQVLARLSDESLGMDLREQRAAVSEATVTLQQASSELRRARAVEEIGLSKQQVEGYAFAERRAQAALESAKARLNTIELRLEQTTIRAPDDGYVSSRSAVVGEVAPAGSELFRMVRQGRLEWRPELDGKQLSAVEAGQTVRIQLPTGTKIDGVVREVGPTLSQDTGRALVYVTLPQAGEAKPGMFASGSILLGAQPALTVPEAAVVPRDGRSYLYLVDGDATVHSRVVETGRRHEGRVEILSDLDPQARIVARGGAFLSENAKVRVADELPPQGGSRE